MSRDRGVATPWSATGGGVASAPLRRLQLADLQFGVCRPPYIRAGWAYDVEACCDVSVRLQKRGRGVTDRGVMAQKVLRGFQRLSGVFRDF